LEYETANPDLEMLPVPSNGSTAVANGVSRPTTAAQSPTRRAEETNGLPKVD
jgi:hypothetical protein